MSALTGNDNYFEDFIPGDVMRHARGKTVTEMDGVLLTHLVMNTAQGHFNEHLMASSPFGGTIVFGGIIAAIVIGLSSQDTAENAVAEVGLNGVRFSKPVHHGDTLYAFTEVLSKDDVSSEVTFRHWGVNQRDEVVFEGDRRVRMKKRAQS